MFYYCASKFSGLVGKRQKVLTQKDIKMKRDREFDELLRKKISETLEEPIDESIDADDLMFDLGMRYLRMAAAEKKKNRGEKKKDPLSLGRRRRFKKGTGRLCQYRDRQKQSGLYPAD